MSDKYPDDSGRRRFVKGVVGGATLAGVGATGATAINSATSSSGAGGGSTQAMAIENIAGPAPRGMPQIPIEIDDEGYLKGIWPEVKTIEQNGVKIKVAELEDYKGSGVTYTSEWFQYCGVESYAGIQPEYESDNYFISGSDPGYTWQSEAYSEGDRLHVDDFSDYKDWGNGVGKSGLGKGATGRWRSEDAEDIIPIQVVRSEKIEEAAKDDPWLKASTQDGFMAWLNKCTHFCCVPKYKTDGSAKFNAEDDVYCQCHQSVYDPFSIVQTLFVARPRPQ
ncbi:ubiquinol-cytochrome c reductase iron-sulfur subunit [Halogeometricum borinquense]|uniref:Ubiquinol-cytochrome c reductase iron-sulfur subunit n=1 Tax=Halogeometricum borinquense TaxID=60847 RepID=A0A482TMH7_9EURY|nr:ubiquinol-cytochrome c reductase iron-sulfur subunit [Halogeometricum borinquense]RYJ14411.1 ubiquinol-cytochrome c reductase iron-sulfur subunit [Halogeometricum borinquense]